MGKQISSFWLSVYLFYNEPWETFLEKAIYPYISTLKQTGIAEQYFFIRYYEKGPHIRLRIKGDPEIIKSMVRPNLEEYFLQYYDSRPSFRVDPPGTNWNPNNTIVFSKYRPEINRFGGINGMELAEKHFHASSELVLKLIKSFGNQWNYEEALGAAIQIQLIMIAALGFDRANARMFFRAYFQNWSQFFSADEERKSEISDPSVSFERAYKIQKSSINPIVQNLWLGLENKSLFDSAILNDWFQFNTELKTQYDKVYKNLELKKQPDNTFLWPAHFSPNQKNALLWPIFSDLLHLTNNRLGVLNQDEGYLGYLLMRALDAMKGVAVGK